MLLDTSGLYSCLDPRDAQFDHATTLFDAAAAKFTHNYVLDELVALSERRGLNRLLVLDFSRDLLVSEEIEVVWVDPELHAAALALLRERLDKSYSLCDAVSFVLMRRRGEREGGRR